MSSQSLVRRSGLFRLITVTASGIGAASLGFWAIMVNRIGTGGGFDLDMPTVAVTGLAALAGAGCAHAFFIGVDEASRHYEGALETDALTGLLSKIGLQRKIAQLPLKDEDAVCESHRWVLISLEIDALRDINDVHGQDIGDNVLRTVGRRIKRLVGRLGPVARIGGSEFAFAVQINRDDRETHAIMNAILNEIGQPVTEMNATVPVFCNAGIAEIPAEDFDINKLLRQTNLARATARGGGLGNWAIYHPEMTQFDTYRKWIETELARAVRNEDFDLLYQPQIDTATNKTVGYEALIRWNHYEKGVIPPSEFVAVAEQCGLITQIGNWVIRRACEDVKLFAPDTTIAVNVSPKQMDSPDFVETLASILRSCDVAPERIEIEITENVLIFDPATARSQFERIRALGCSIAIDDFGTGYSNLNYLSELPFTKLKLDRSFVTRIEERDNGGPMVSTIVNLARALDVDILAEGVETENQVAMLKAAGCSLMQGYIFGKPFILDRFQQMGEVAA